MTQPLLDYHVGLLRGFLIAMKADRQIMYALDIMLSHYNGQKEPVISNYVPAETTLTPETPAVAQVVTSGGFARWQADEIEFVQNSHAANMGCAEILKGFNHAFPHRQRKYHTLYAKMAALGLS